MARAFGSRRFLPGSNELVDLSIRLRRLQRGISTDSSLLSRARRHLVSALKELHQAEALLKSAPGQRIGGEIQLPFVVLHYGTAGLKTMRPGGHVIRTAKEWQSVKPRISPTLPDIDFTSHIIATFVTSTPTVIIPKKIVRSRATGALSIVLNGDEILQAKKTNVVVLKIPRWEGPVTFVHE